MKIIVNSMLDDKICNELIKKNFEPVHAPVNKNIPSPVNTHPDMQLCVIDGKIVCDMELWDFYHSILKDSGVEIIKGKTKTQGNYPDDIAYNIKVVGNNVFHNLRYTDESIVELIKEKNIINISQGYSGCTICRAGENAIITADKAIHQCAMDNSIESLLISQGDISLPPYEYGFIGGASFYYEEKVFFFGDINTHRDYRRIKEFCDFIGSEIISLSDKKLYDYGSAFVFE